MVLLPRFGMKADLDYDPTGDWEDDKVSDLNVLNYQAFFKALFKVPDLWCDGVEASDYTKLLNELLEEAQKRTALWNRLLHRYGAMDQNGPKRVIGFGASAAKNLLLVSTDVAAAKKFGSMLGASSSNSPQASSKTNPFGKPPASPKPDSSLEDSPKAAAEPTTSKAAPWVWKNPQPSPRPPGLEPSPSPMASSGGGKFLRGNPPTPLVPFLGTSQPSSSPAASAGGRFYTISSPSPNPRPSPLLEPALSAATPQRPSTLSVAPKGAKPPPVNLPNISSSAQSPPDRRSPKAASKGDQPLLPPTSPRPPPTPDDQTVGLMPDSVSSPSHIPFTALELEHEHEHPYQLEKEKVEPDVNPQPQQLDGHAIEGTRQLPAFEEKRDQGGPLSLRVEQMLTDDTTGGPTLSPWSFSEGVDDRLNHQLASTSRTPSNHLVPWGPRASTAAEGAVRVSHSGSLMDGKWYAGGLSPNRVTTASRERRVSQTGPPLTLNPPLTLKLDKDNDNQAQTQQLLVNVPKWVTKPSEAPPPPPAITVDSPSSSPPPKSYGIRNVWETTLLLPSSVDSGRKGVARSSWAGHGTNSPTYSYIWAPPRTSYNNSPRFQSPLWQNMSITPSGNASSGRPNINQSSDGSNPYQPSPTSPTGQGAADRVSPTGGSLHKGRSRWASSSGTFDQTRTRVSYGGGSSESSRLLRPSMSGGPGGEQLQPRMSGGIGENNMPRVGAASTWMNVDRTSPSQASNVELNSLDLFAQAFPKPLGAKQQQPGQITQFQKRFSTDGQKR